MVHGWKELGMFDSYEVFNKLPCEAMTRKMPPMSLISKASPKNGKEMMLLEVIMSYNKNIQQSDW